MIRKLIIALAIVTLTTTPAFARGGGGGFSGGSAGTFHGGGGGTFHGGSGGAFRGGEFHGGAFRGDHERFERFDRFHRFHRFGFFGDFGFVGPAFGFGVDPFFWDPYWFPSPYPAYTYAPPLVIQPEPQASVLEPSASYRYHCVDAKAYYPYTQQCPGGWLKVVPTP